MSRSIIFCVLLSLLAFASSSHTCHKCIKTKGNKFGITTKDQPICENGEKISNFELKFVTGTDTGCDRIRKKLDQIFNVQAGINHENSVTTTVPAITTYVPSTIFTSTATTTTTTSLKDQTVTEPDYVFVSDFTTEESTNQNDATTDTTMQPSAKIPSIEPGKRKETQEERLLRSLCRSYSLVQRYKLKHKGKGKILGKGIYRWNSRSVIADKPGICASLALNRG